MRCEKVGGHKSVDCLATTSFVITCGGAKTQPILKPGANIFENVPSKITRPSLSKLYIVWIKKDELFYSGHFQKYLLPASESVGF